MRLRGALTGRGGRRPAEPSEGPRSGRKAAAEAFRVPLTEREPAVAASL